MSTNIKLKGQINGYVNHMKTLQRETLENILSYREGRGSYIDDNTIKNEHGTIIVRFTVHGASVKNERVKHMITTPPTRSEKAPTKISELQDGDVFYTTNAYGDVHDVTFEKSNENIMRRIAVGNAWITEQDAKECVSQALIQNADIVESLENNKKEVPKLSLADITPDMTVVRLPLIQLLGVDEPEIQNMLNIINEIEVN